MPRSSAVVLEPQLASQALDHLATVQRQCEDRARCWRRCAARCTRAGTRHSTATAASSARGRKSNGASARPSQPRILRGAPGIGPRLGVAGGDLPAVGEAGFERRSRLPIDDDDVVPGLAQEPGAGDADHPGAEDKDAHAADPEDSNRNRFYGARIPRLRLAGATPRSRHRPDALRGCACVCTISRFRRRNPPLLSGAAATNHRANFPEPIIVRPTLIEEKRS